MLLQTGVGLNGMGMRQALNITQVWLTTRTPHEIASSEAVNSALLDENSISDNAELSELGDTTLESLLDSL
jgi:hypothetical protein